MVEDWLKQISVSLKLETSILETKFVEFLFWRAMILWSLHYSIWILDAFHSAEPSLVSAGFRHKGWRERGCIAFTTAPCAACVLEHNQIILLWSLMLYFSSCLLAWCGPWSGCRCNIVCSVPCWKLLWRLSRPTNSLKKEIQYSPEWFVTA
jgi:hypothetical protein